MSRFSSISVNSVRCLLVISIFTFGYLRINSQTGWTRIELAIFAGQPILMWPVLWGPNSSIELAAVFNAAIVGAILA